jgi:hypothetical protein
MEQKQPSPQQSRHMAPSGILSSSRSMPMFMNATRSNMSIAAATAAANAAANAAAAAGVTSPRHGMSSSSSYPSLHLRQLSTASPRGAMELPSAAFIPSPAQYHPGSYCFSPRATLGSSPLASKLDIASPVVSNTPSQHVLTSPTGDMFSFRNVSSPIGASPRAVPSISNTPSASHPGDVALKLLQLKSTPVASPNTSSGSAQHFFPAHGPTPRAMHGMHQNTGSDSDYGSSSDDGHPHTGRARSSSIHRAATILLSPKSAAMQQQHQQQLSSDGSSSDDSSSGHSSDSADSAVDRRGNTKKAKPATGRNRSGGKKSTLHEKARGSKPPPAKRLSRMSRSASKATDNSTDIPQFDGSVDPASIVTEISDNGLRKGPAAVAVGKKHACTWPGCDKLFRTPQAVFGHMRMHGPGHSMSATSRRASRKRKAGSKSKSKSKAKSKAKSKSKATATATAAIKAKTKTKSTNKNSNAGNADTTMATMAAMVSVPPMHASVNATPMTSTSPSTSAQPATSPQPNSLANSPDATETMGVVPAPTSISLSRTSSLRHKRKPAQGPGDITVAESSNVTAVSVPSPEASSTPSTSPVLAHVSPQPTATAKKAPPKRRRLSASAAKRLLVTGPYGCPHDGCTRSFLSVQALAGHQRMHPKVEITLPCEYPNCGKSFSSAHALAGHMRIHGGNQRTVGDGISGGWQPGNASQVHVKPTGKKYSQRTSRSQSKNMVGREEEDDQQEADHEEADDDSDSDNEQGHDNQYSGQSRHRDNNDRDRDSDGSSGGSSSVDGNADRDGGSGGSAGGRHGGNDGSSSDRGDSTGNGAGDGSRNNSDTNQASVDVAMETVVHTESIVPIESGAVSSSPSDDAATVVPKAGSREARAAARARKHQQILKGHVVLCPACRLQIVGSGTVETHIRNNHARLLAKQAAFEQEAKLRSKHTLIRAHHGHAAADTLASPYVDPRSIDVADYFADAAAEQLLLALIAVSNRGSATADGRFDDDDFVEMFCSDDRLQVRVGDEFQTDIPEMFSKSASGVVDEPKGGIRVTISELSQASQQPSKNCFISGPEIVLDSLSAGYARADELPVGMHASFKPHIPSWPKLALAQQLEEAAKGDTASQSQSSAASTLSQITGQDGSDAAGNDVDDDVVDDDINDDDDDDEDDDDDDDTIEVDCEVPLEPRGRVFPPWPLQDYSSQYDDLILDKYDEAKAKRDWTLRRFFVRVHPHARHLLRSTASKSQMSIPHVELSHSHSPNRTSKSSPPASPMPGTASNDFKTPPRHLLRVEIPLSGHHPKSNESKQYANRRHRTPPISSPRLHTSASSPTLRVPGASPTSRGTPNRRRLSISSPMMSPLSPRVKQRRLRSFPPRIPPAGLGPVTVASRSDACIINSASVPNIAIRSNSRRERSQPQLLSYPPIKPKSKTGSVLVAMQTYKMTRTSTSNKNKPSAMSRGTRMKIDSIPLTDNGVSNENSPDTVKRTRSSARDPSKTAFTTVCSNCSSAIHLDRPIRKCPLCKSYLRSRNKAKPRLTT